MSETTGQYGWILKLARVALVASLVLLGLTVVAAVAMTVIVLAQGGGWVAPVHQILVIAGAVVAVLVAFVAYGLVRVLVGMEFATSSAVGRLSRIETLMDAQQEYTRKLLDLNSLSDKARSLLFRDRELEAMREVIHHELMGGNYTAAEGLIESMDSEFGYADEARELRGEIEASRQATLDEKIDAAVGRIQAFIDTQNWDRAIRESQRILTLFPDNPKIASLPKRINSARADYKRDLLERYGEAVRKKDVDLSITLLRELDNYLTPQEAAALQESARGVFKARLHQLGVQFAIRVTEEQWTEAIAAGETIMREFPNSRMAQEVRDKMDRLRDYAAAANEAAG